MPNRKNLLFLVLAISFVAFGISAYFKSQPEPKNMQVYQEIKKYSPYYIDKRFGGLQIMSKADAKFKEQPDNMAVFHRLDELEKEWGRGHLKIENSQLHILDDNRTVIAAIPLHNQDEMDFVHRFYGIR